LVQIKKGVFMGKKHNVKRKVKSRRIPLVFPKYHVNLPQLTLNFPRPSKLKVYLSTLFKKSEKPVVKPEKQKAWAIQKPKEVKVSPLKLDLDLEPISLKVAQKDFVSEKRLVKEGEKLAKLSERFKPKVKYTPHEKPRKVRLYISRDDRELLAEEEILKRKLDNLY